MLTQTTIAAVWLSRKNELDCLVWLIQVESLWLVINKNIQRDNQKWSLKDRKARKELAK